MSGPKPSPALEQAPESAPVLIDRLVDLAWLVIAVVVLVFSTRLGMTSAFGPGPGLFPAILGGLLLVLAILRLAGPAIAVARTGSVGTISWSVPKDTRVPALKFVLLSAAVFIYAAGLEQLGFVIMSVLLCWCVLMIFGQKPVRSLLAAIAAAAVLKVGFGNLLEVQLPTSSLAVLAGLGL